MFNKKTFIKELSFFYKKKLSLVEKNNKIKKTFFYKNLQLIKKSITIVKKLTNKIVVIEKPAVAEKCKIIKI